MAADDDIDDDSPLVHLTLRAPVRVVRMDRSEAVIAATGRFKTWPPSSWNLGTVVSLLTFRARETFVAGAPNATKQTVDMVVHIDNIAGWVIVPEAK